MARITIEEVYCGEKYDVMSAVMADCLKNGRPQEYDERTWLDLPILKHTLIAVYIFKIGEDASIGITDAGRPFGMLG